MTADQHKPHDNAQELAQIGERLFNRRMELGLSLADVETETKVRARYLGAMEQGRPDILPGPVYAVGFVRSYAAHLGFDGPAVAAEYQKALSSPGPRRERSGQRQPEPKPDNPKQPEPAASAPVIAEPPLRTRPQSRPATTRTPGRTGAGSRKRSPWRAWGIMLLLVTLAAGVYIVYSAQRAIEPPPPNGEAGPVDPPDEPDPEPPPPPTPTFGPEHITTATGSGGELLITVDWPDLQVELIFADRVWLRATVDGQVAADGTQAAGSVLALAAQDRIDVRLGRAVQTRIVIFGVDLGQAGTADDARTVIIELSQ